MKFAYADPPYPGQAKRHYGYDKEVNHEILIGTLQQYDGWALSTSSTALHNLLPLCPERTRVAAWVKPFAAGKKTVKPINAWEPILFQPALMTLDDPQTTLISLKDWISEFPPIFSGENRGLPGCKPLRFCMWILDIIGYRPGCEMWDVFPGTEIMAEAVRQYDMQAPLRYRTPSTDTQESLL